MSMLIVKLPFQLLGREGMLFPLLEIGTLSNTGLNFPQTKTLQNIAVLKGHRLDSDTELYYSALEKLVCTDGDLILNLTGDSLIPYLCGNPRNSSRIPFFNDQLLSNIDQLELNRIRTGHFYTKELIVSQDVQSTEGLVLRGVVTRPQSFRWFKEGKIFVYENRTVR